MANTTIVEVVVKQPLSATEINSFIPVPTGGTTGQVLSKASNNTGDLVWGNAGGASATNLSVANKTSTTFDVLSSTGNDVTLPQATTTEAGLLIATDKVKLNSLSTVATSGSYADLSNIPSTFTPSAHTHVIADTTGLQTALDSKAALGANSDITSLSGITGAISTVDSVQFDTTFVSTPATGKLNWNDTDGTLEVGLKGGNVTLQIGQENNQRVTNNSGTSIADGSVVYITGSLGNRLTIAAAIASSEANAERTFGVLTETIADNQSGFVTTLGLVRDINTSTLTEGAPVYLSASVVGALTSVRPVAPNHAVMIGWCVRQHATIGSIFVHVQNGGDLSELHDVTLNSKADKDVLSYESSSGIWKNKQLTSAYITDFSTAVDARVTSGITGKENTITAGTTAQYWRGDKTWQTLDKTAVGLGNVDNTSDVTKNSASATLTNKTISGASNTLSNIAQSSITSLVSDLAGKQPLDGDLTAIAALAGTSGFLKKTAVDTWTLDTSTYYLASNPSGYTTNTGTVTTASIVTANGFSGSVATASTTPAITLTLQNATTSQSGQLTSTDWNTFNSKQTALNGAGFVKVTGTTVSYDNSTYLTSNQSITLSGDASGSGATAITVTLGSNVVSNAKLAQVPTATFKGRVTASTGNVEDLTATQATSLLDTFTTSSKGLVGASGGGTTNFLRADGTWAVPSGGGGGLTLTEIEVDFGTKPTRSKKFTITNASISGSSKVIVSPSGNVATGRVGDDWEWDSISTSAKAGTGQFILTCFASGKVAGKRKFYYTYQ